MTCKSVMTVAPLTVNGDDAVRHAVDLVLTQQSLAIPVLEKDGKLCGMFGLHRLLELVLPRAASMDQGIGDLAFMRDRVQDLQARLNHIAERPVRDFAEPPAAVLHPDTPLVETLFLLYKTRHVLPVTDKASGKLVGTVSSWLVLRHITGRS